MEHLMSISYYTTLQGQLNFVWDISWYKKNLFQHYIGILKIKKKYIVCANIEENSKAKEEMPQNG